jgi:hypothetical protein
MARTKDTKTTTVTIHDQKLTRGSGGELHQFGEACRKLRLWARETKVKL